MKRKSYASMTCPIARSLEHVGDWWNILILRDAAYGLTRFDHFQKALGIGTAMLTRRLNQLVKGELLTKRRYSSHPPRYEYLLTDRGREFRQVLLAFVQFGNRHFAPDGESVLIAERNTGRTVDLALFDRAAGREIPAKDLGLVAGPRATEGTKLRLALAAGALSADTFVEKLAALKAPPKRKPREASVA